MDGLTFGLRVLIVDDHLAVRTAISQYLRSLPNIEKVVAAPNGTLAITVARDLHPHLCLIDAMMEPSGAATVKAMHLVCPSAVCVGMTMSLEPEVQQQLIDAGCRTVIDKADLPRLAEIAQELAADPEQLPQTCE